MRKIDGFYFGLVKLNAVRMALYGLPFSEEYDKVYREVIFPDGSPVFKVPLFIDDAIKIATALNNLVLIRDNTDIDPQYIAKTFINELIETKPTF